jgi:PAS domain S-box-containing protein
MIDQARAMMSTQRAQPVLLVTADASAADAERSAITRTGLMVESAPSVVDAIGLLLSRGYGALVLDHPLPHDDAWRVLAVAQAQHPRVPVIVVSAREDPRVHAEALARGAVACLVKSESFASELPRVVERVAKLAAAEARALRSEALFRMIADSSSELIASVDLRGVIQVVSSALTPLLGYEPDDVLGKQSLGFVHPDDRARVAQAFAGRLDHGRVTYRQRRKDDTFAWVEVSTSLVRDEVSGDPQEILAVLRDISERRRAEDKLRTLLEGTPDALVIVDPNGMIALVNARTEQLFGYARHELLGRPVELLVVERLRSDTPWRRAADARNPDAAELGVPREIVGLRRDGTEFPAELSLNWLETDGQRLVSSAIVDTTARKTIQDREFLLKLGQELPRFEDVDSLTWHVVSTIAEYLGVDGCMFSEIDLARGMNTVHRDYARVVPSAAGTYPLAALTPTVRAELEAGRVVAVLDTRSDARTAELYEERYQPRNIRAMVGVPLMRDGVWLAAIFAFTERPRAWAAREIQMLQALAERTWLWLEHLRMLRALRDSEAQYRRLIESTHEGVWEIDAEANTTFVNRRMAEMLGYTVNEMLGQTLGHFTDAEGRAQLAGDVARRKAGIAESQDFKFLRKDGLPIWARLEVSPLTDERGHYSGALAMVADVTERKQSEQDQQFLFGLAEALTVTNDAEAAKRASAGRLADHLSVDRCLFIDIDVSAQRANIRDEWQRTPGPSLVGDHALNPLSPLAHELAAGRTVIVSDTQSDPRAVPRFERLAAHFGARSFVVIPLHKEGRWIACLAFLRAGPHAWTHRELGLGHATLERTSLCVERLQSIAALRDFNRDLERRVDERTRELQAALREKEVLLKEIHHRVKNNLQVISSMLSLQAMHLPDATSRSMFAETQGRVQSIALVHESLYRSKDLSSVRFVEYLRSLVHAVFLAQSAHGRHVEAVVESADVKLPVAAAIPCGLIVNELVTNALKHAFADGRRGQIHVGLRQVDSEYIELRVADDGVGMSVPPDPLQGVASLGLDLVYTFADQIDARVELSSAHGTDFRLTFRNRAE